MAADKFCIPGPGWNQVNYEYLGPTFKGGSIKCSDGKKLFRQQVNFLPKGFLTQGRVISDLKREAKLFERFESDRYMDAMGLFVLPEFRRNGIAEKLLEARIPLCKMLGIKGTANTFSSHPVRRVAAKAGFEVYCEISMAQIGKMLGKDLPEDEFVKLMGIKIV